MLFLVTMMQHEKFLETEQNVEKFSKEECAIEHKQLTSHPLTGHFTPNRHLPVQS